jgi:hypothetical protein
MRCFPLVVIDAVCFMVCTTRTKKKVVLYYEYLILQIINDLHQNLTQMTCFILVHDARKM